MREDAEGWFRDLQMRIVDALESVDGGRFLRDPWKREPGADPNAPHSSSGGLGGEGLSCVLEGGNVIERGAVLFSSVEGAKLPPSATQKRPEIAGRPFVAVGVSLVIHPRNPRVPTAHMNVRSLSTKDGAAAWLGGGFDLTPYYAVDDDIVHWHRTAQSACAPFGKSVYPALKARCDEYFYLKHRQETRGVGGLFLDDLDEDTDFGDGALGSRARAFALIQSIGEAFVPAYAPIVMRRKDEPYGERERDWQLYRRGRYVEFNLVFDRGTHFGLQSGGRTESILGSMPPLASWKYNYQPAAGSPEAALREYLKPRDWLRDSA